VTDQRQGLQRGGTIADVVEGLPQAQAAMPAAEPTSAGDVFSASRILARSDRSDAEELRLNRGYSPIVEALGMDAVDNPANFYNSQGLYNISRGKFEFWSDTTRDQQEQNIANRIRERRKKDPGFLPGVPDNVTNLRQYFLQGEKSRRDDARSTVSRATGIGATVAGFAGGVAESMLDPVNIATLPLGGGGKTILGIAAREALFNGAIEVLQAPTVAANRKALGEDYTTEDFLTSVGYAAAGGAVLGTGAHVGGKALGRGYDATVAQVFQAMPEGVQRRWADRMKVGDQPVSEFFAGLSDRDAIRFSRDVIGRDSMAPDERAASVVLNRAADVSEASPFHGSPTGDEAHTSRLAETLNALLERRPPPPEPTIAPGATTSRLVSPAIANGSGAAPRPIAYGVSGEGAIDSYMVKTRGAESSGDDMATAGTSSAGGRYQFTDGTWVSYYRRRFGANVSRQEALARKFDGGVQETLMRDLTADNAAQLQGSGLPVNEGTLYLSHFLGPRDAKRVLQADPARPLEGLISQDSINANASILRGKSASEVVQWAQRKMGGDAAAVQLRAGQSLGGDVEGGDFKIAQLRAEALALQTQAIGEVSLTAGGSVPTMSTKAFRPDDLIVDAARFQFKSGGDDFGVSDRLQGITEWNPIYAGRVVVWEDAAGRSFIADGHQRRGLAKRIETNGGGDVQLDATVLREADGVSAQDARVWAALKNIAEGTGTAIDAAKVVRDAGIDVLRDLPPKSPLVRDGAALARLSDDAFGAVYNGVVPADQAAIIGHLLPDRPEAHGAMIDLLARLDPANRGQAESIVRQGIAAGFHKEVQEELFGAREMTSSLFMERARVLERGLARLRKLKLVYGTAAKEADTLERAGSAIARDQSAKEAANNAQALEIVSRLAFSAGTPVADALNAAAAKLAAGGRIADVVGEFVDSVRAVDLRDAARGKGADDSGRLAPDGAGRGGDAGAEDVGIPAEPSDTRQPSLAELEDAGQVSMFDVAQVKRFDDPIHGDGPTRQIESLEHDVRMDLAPARDPNVASKAALAAGLQAKAPLRPVGVDTEGTIGMGLFDAVDQPTFRLDTDGGERDAADLLRELDEDDAAIATLQACMVP